MLGGLGSLGDSEDQEELERQREDEEDRLRSLGYGITGTDEFRESVDGWLTLIEFTQEVLVRCKAAEDSLATGEDDDLVDEEAREQRFVMAALAASILSSLRSSLLENVLCKFLPNPVDPSTLFAH